MEQQTKKRFILDFSFTVLVVAIVYVSGKFLFQYLFPFVIGAVIAWAVQKPAGIIASKIKLKKGICAALLTALLFLTAVFILFFVLSRLAVASKELIKELPVIFDFTEKLLSRLKKSITSMSGGISDGVAHGINEMALDLFENFKSNVTKAASGMAAAAAGRLPSFLFSSIVTLVAGCYIAKDFEGLSKFLGELSGKRVYSTVIKVKNIFVNTVLKLIKGYLILMLLTFLELTIGLFIMGIKHAVLTAFLISIIDLLPIFGAGTVLIPWSVAELLMGNTGRGVGFLAVYLVISVVRNFSEPKIIGGQIGINPIFTLVTMFAGLKIFGFLGLFLFPIAFIVIFKYYKDEMETEKIGHL